MHGIIADLYKDFRVTNGAIPYFLMHVIADVKSYDIKVYADLRKFFFKPHMEDMIFEKIKSTLWSLFNR